MALEVPADIVGEIIAKKNILIVEDNVTDAILLSTRVHRLYPKYNILFAGSVYAAYNACKEHEIDLILLDLNLPDGYGANTVEEIKRFNRRSPIIVVTGMETEELAEASLELGADNFLKKSRLSGEAFKKMICEYLVK